MITMVMVPAMILVIFHVMGFSDGEVISPAKYRGIAECQM
jgi:hypothetical protein